MPKKLVFDALEDEGELDEIELTLNGTTVSVFRPTSGQVAIMMAAFSDESTAANGAQALLSFYRNISVVEYAETDDDGFGVPGSELPTAHDLVKAFLSNPRIGNSLERMMELTEKVIEAFSGNPTKSPTDYLPSRQTGGRSSTASRRQATSTRSRSPRPASATGSTPTSSRSSRERSE